jgi:hypothetical protein
VGTGPGSNTRRQDTINERLSVAIEGPEKIQARIETLRRRMIRSEENGRDARQS